MILELYVRNYYEVHGTFEDFTITCFGCATKICN